MSMDRAVARGGISDFRMLKEAKLLSEVVTAALISR